MVAIFVFRHSLTGRKFIKIINDESGSFFQPHAILRRIFYVSCHEKKARHSCVCLMREEMGFFMYKVIERSLKLDYKHESLAAEIALVYRKNRRERFRSRLGDAYTICCIASLCELSSQQPCCFLQLSALKSLEKLFTFSFLSTWSSLTAWCKKYLEASSPPELCPETAGKVIFPGGFDVRPVYISSARSKVGADLCHMTRTPLNKTTLISNGFRHGSREINNSI